MKKITLSAIAVLFLLVGLCYAQDVAGPLSTLKFKITYEEYLPPTNAKTDGRQLIAVMSGLSSVYEPALYIKPDPNTGLIARIWISWINPNINDPLYNQRILAISCSGGNTAASIPNPGLPVPTDGGISTKKQLPVKNTPTTRTDSAQGVAACHVCPNGFGFNPDGSLTGLCNDGTSYVSGYITYTGKSTKDLLTKQTISVSVSATVGAGGFDYIGEDWAVALDPTTHLSTKDCNTYGGIFPYCDAVLAGTLKATLTPCTNANPSWTNCPYQ
jgi:hypothetical protein